MFSILPTDHVLNIITKLEKSCISNICEALTPSEHIDLMWLLINTLLETRKIKSAIRNEIDQKNNIFREKACLEIEMYIIIIQ